jgi:predicted amidohydrolase YtcJ
MHYGIKGPLTLAIIHAKLWTGKPDHSLNGDAIGVIGDTIVSVSDTQSVLSFCNSNTVVIDAQWGMLLPGFTDCHCHFLDAGLRLLSVQLRNAKTREQFTDRVARRHPNYLQVRGLQEGIGITNSGAVHFQTNRGLMILHRIIQSGSTGWMVICL